MWLPSASTASTTTLPLSIGTSAANIPHVW
jgi:hypothetical protein